MSNEQIKRWTSMIRIRDRQRQAAELETRMRQAEVDAIQLRLDHLHREYDEAVAHCRAELPRQPHFVTQYQAALNQLRTQVEQTRQAHREAQDRLRDARQVHVEANVALEQVQTIGNQLKQEQTTRWDRQQNLELLERSIQIQTKKNSEEHENG